MRTHRQTRHAAAGCAPRLRAGLPVHAEFAGIGAIVTPTLVPRSARVQLAWRY